MTAATTMRMIMLAVSRDGPRIGDAFDVDTHDLRVAKLAAEDALLAIAAEIVGAVGR